MSTPVLLRMVDAALLRARVASRVLAATSQKERNAVLRTMATLLERDTARICAENRKDAARMEVSDPRYDRLLLTPERVRGLAADVRRVAKLASPVGEAILSYTLPNGLLVEQRRVPLGVVGMVYEARPNVTVDAAALLLKTGNAAVLKGGSDADASSRALVACIHEALAAHGLPKEVVVLLPAERAVVGHMLSAVGMLDVVIPRGGAGLIRMVRETAKVPVIETGAGVVHMYVDAGADLRMAERCIVSAKTRRPSVCNALDTLLVHEAVLAEVPRLVARLAEKGVKIHADKAAYAVLKKSGYPQVVCATKHSFGTEFLGYEMSVCTVPDMDAALMHIARYSSGHSEAIVTRNRKNAERFLNAVDAACVYHNTETGFSDGASLGLGAEIGISTQKLHARGPMALTAMTTYKWIVRGSGQTRS